MSNGVPLDELALTFASSASGVAFTPATVLTDADGSATASTFVPFGTIPIVAVSGGGVVADLSLRSVLPTPALDLPTAGLSAATAVGGTNVTISATATGFAGLQVTFTSNLTGVSFSPSTAITSATGSATVVAYVPFGTIPIVTVTGAGGFASVSLKSVLPVASIKVASPRLVGSTQTGSNGGSTYAVTATVEDASGAALVGASVAFAGVGVSNAFSPATVVTDQNGSATSYVFVGNLANNTGPGAITAVVTAAGVTSDPFTVP
jgi:hypothetical protein